MTSRLAMAALMCLTTTTANAAPPGRARQLHYFYEAPALDEMIESTEGSIYYASSFSECAPYARCLRFADPVSRTYDTGGRFTASLTTRPIYIEYPSKLWLALGLVTENISPFDRASVAIQCEGETGWRTMFQRSTSYGDGVQGRSIPIAPGDFGEMCRFKVAFDSGDGIANAFPGLSIASFALDVAGTADPDGDFSDNSHDWCPNFFDPDQELHSFWTPGSYLDVTGRACRVELVPELIGYLQRGVYATQETSLYHLRDTVRFSAVGLPPGMSIDPASGELHGIPRVEGSYTFDVVAYGGDSYTARRRYEVLVGPPLTDDQRLLLAQLALIPQDSPTKALVRTGSVTRFERQPVIFFAVDPARGGSYIGIEPDGSKAPGRLVMEDYLRRMIPVISGGKFEAIFVDAQPTDGTPWIRVSPTSPGAGPMGNRTTSESGTSVWGAGEIVEGRLWFPESDFREAPEGYPFNWTFAHELGHVFNGPHTALPGSGFVQQRHRIHAPLSLLGYAPDPLSAFTIDEALVYEVFYRLPVGTDRAQLRDAGLVLDSELAPAPRLSSVHHMELRTDRYVVVRARDGEPFRAGERIAIWGGQLWSPWHIAGEHDGSIWTRSAIRLPGVPILLSSLSTPPGPDFELQVVLPAGVTSGMIVVEHTHIPTGQRFRSNLIPIEIEP